MKTLRERYEAALRARGETLVKSTFKYDVFTSPRGKFFYVGRSGALRIGSTVASSIPCSAALKAALLERETI